MRTHEVPTHLHVEDHLMAGLTVRQVLHVVIGAASGYWLWQNAALPLEARAAGAVAAVLAGLVLALVRPDDQPLATWIARVIAYALTPRRAIWGSTGGHATAPTHATGSGSRHRVAHTVAQPARPNGTRR